MTTSTGGPRPVYLDGHLAPVPDEIDAFDLPVTGALPPELTGRYLRNGPNPRPGEDRGHWFAGHGMLHGVRLQDGHARWYRNRWVRTRLLEPASGVGADGPGNGHRDLAANPANTHVIGHGGRLLALCEGGLPYEMSPELDTTGPQDFGGRLATAMTAHPKQDPVTGELLFFGYGVRPPYLTYHRLSADGELVHSEPVEVPGPTMMHDFAITEHHVVWLDLPVAFDRKLLGRGMPFQWDDSYGARLGVMSRAGGSVQWFEIEPCYVFHVGNAHEDAAGRIVLDGVRYSREAWATFWPVLGGASPRGTSGHEGVDLVSVAADSAASSLHRWTLDPATGSVAEQQLDERGVEFPTVSDAHVGRDSRFCYTVTTDTGRRASSAIVKYDLAGGIQTFDLGEDRVAGEAVFVPAAQPARGGTLREDDGWLLSIISSRTSDASDLLVLDATDVGGAPVATVRLPRRVPTGFHGSWIPDEDLP